MSVDLMSVDAQKSCQCRRGTAADTDSIDVVAPAGDEGQAAGGVDPEQVAAEVAAAQRPVRGAVGKTDPVWLSHYSGPEVTVVVPIV